MENKPKPSVVMSTDILVDSTKEPLLVIVPLYRGMSEVPSEISSGNQATLVFMGLHQCFAKDGRVAEGLLSNIIWGFENSGYDPKHVALGLTELRHRGFIRYTDGWGNPVHDHEFDPKRPIWIRYTDKMLSTCAGEKGEKDLVQGSLT
mgnify:CR=1 FL=1